MKTELYMRVLENNVENDYEGGIVHLMGVRCSAMLDFADARMTLSYNKDEPMRQFPVTREEKQKRHFKITIEEVDICDVPPDTAATPTM
jgi:hypothetical protein